jgi:uncharacterized protein (DUF58 family)
VTRFGLGALLAGCAALATGLTLRWLAFDLLGIGLLGAVAFAAITVWRPSQLMITREIQPRRVPKGTPAIAVLTFANRGTRAVAARVATQRLGSARVRTVIPPLRRGERGTRAYRLPTSERGIFDVAPLEVTHRDAFGLLRRARRYGATERIWVLPRILAFNPLPTGQVRHLDGPTSDTSAPGTITFHRLREYIAGDDLRLVHWRSSAHAGTLLVRHNVDTAQPSTVVLFDLRPSRYTERGFEEAVDVAASVVMAAAADHAPVELRLTDGAVVGGRHVLGAGPLVDHLTGVRASSKGSLREQLLLLRRLRGGTSLVVITGEPDPDDLPAIVALRRRFDRLVLVSLDDSESGRRNADSPHVRVVVAPDADTACSAWNQQLHDVVPFRWRPA